MNILITGGAGFIGSHLARVLLERGNRVVCADNFVLGSRENVKSLMDCERFCLVEGDVSDPGFTCDLMEKQQIRSVYHLAANSDIQKSAGDPGIDYKNTFGTTYSVLEGMRKNQIKKFFFASTSAVYGEKTDELLREDTGDLRPISYYGAGKLASEAFISAYTAMNDLETTIFRFPNVIGPGLTHGVLFDFIRKLKNHPEELEILGDGTQTKPYLYVEDLIEAILTVGNLDHAGLAIYNAGVETATSVREIADLVCRRMGLDHVTYRFTGGNRGWRGDVPRFQYDLSRIHACGWRPRRTSSEAVWETLEKTDPGTLPAEEQQGETPCRQ